MVRTVFGIVFGIESIQIVQVDTILIILYFLSLFRDDFRLTFVEFQRTTICFYVQVKALLVRHDVFYVQEILSIQDHLF